MRFLDPSQLYWGAVVTVPIVLYLFRRKPTKVPVSTLLFFKALATEHQESAWLRRLKRLLSLLLTLLIVLATVGVLARLVAAPPAGSLRSVVILMDRSASMAARGADGRTRLKDAVARVRDRLAGLPAGTSVVVMAYDRRPDILLPASFDRREAERVLSAIQARPIEGNPEPALYLARRMAALEPPSSIWHATDRPVRTPGSEDPEVPGEPGTAAPVIPTIETIDVRLASPVNAGITAFEIRRLPLERGRFDAFVQVHVAAPQPIEAELEVRLDGTLTAMRRLSAESGGRHRLVIPINAGEGKTLWLKVKVNGDALPEDDQLFARLPEPKPIRTLWITPAADPFTQLALATLGNERDIQVFQAEPSAWPPKGGVDVVIFDHWVPEEWPADQPAIVINPPGNSGPIHARPLERGGLPVDALRVTEDRHPLLYGVASSRLSLTQTAVLQGDGSLEPLWVGPSGPILLAGEVGGQRLVVMAFAPERSEHLPLTASYPLLVGNAIYWAAQPGTGELPGRNYRTGHIVRLGGTSITWSIPTPRERGVTRMRLASHWVELDRIGLWETELGESGSAALLSPGETQLLTPDGGKTNEAARPAVTPSRILQGDLSTFLLWAVLGLLLAESWLFHRHGVY